MRRLITQVLLCLLVFNISPSPAFGATKQGKPCKTPGQISESGGFRFSCNKTGGKMIWGKGTKIDRPKPSPSATPTINILSAPPVPIGVISTKPECLKSSCSYTGNPQGSVIVVPFIRSEILNFGTVNNLTQFQVKFISPTGKVFFTTKMNIPVEYDSTSFNTAEIGVWNVQVAAFSASGQTEWANYPIQVTVLSQAGKANPGLKACSPKTESVIESASRAYDSLMFRIETNWNKYFEIKEKYIYASNLGRQSDAESWLNILKGWRSLLQTDYQDAGKLKTSYETLIKSCNTNIKWPDYVEPKD